MALTKVPLCGNAGVGYIPVPIKMRYGFFVACFGNVGEDTATPPSNKKAPVGTGLITAASPPHPGWEDAGEADVINPVPYGETINVFRSNSSSTEPDGIS